MKRKIQVEGPPPKKRKLNSPATLDLQDSSPSSESDKGRKFKLNLQSWQQTVADFDAKHVKLMKGQKYGYWGIIQDDKSLLWKAKREFGRQTKVSTTIFKTKKEAAMSSDTLWRTFGGDMIRLNFPSEKEKKQWVQRSNERSKRLVKPIMVQRGVSNESVFEFRGDEGYPPRRPVKRKVKILRTSSEETDTGDIQVIPIPSKKREQRSRRKPKRYVQDISDEESEKMKPVIQSDLALAKKQKPKRIVKLDDAESKKPKKVTPKQKKPQIDGSAKTRRKRTPKRKRDSNSDGDFVPEKVTPRRSTRPRRARKKSYSAKMDEKYAYWNKFEIGSGNLDGATLQEGQEGTFFICENAINVTFAEKVIKFVKRDIIFIKAFAHGEGDYVHCYFLYIKACPTTESTELSTPLNDSHHLIVQVPHENYEHMENWLSENEFAKEDFAKMSREEFDAVCSRQSFELNTGFNCVNSEISTNIVLTYPSKTFSNTSNGAKTRGAVSLSERDIQRLEPFHFLNDTIIDFYLKYLSLETWKSEENEKYLALNTFVYTKLKSSGSLPKRWTKRYDPFKYEYIFLPMCEKFHWSLMIICNSAPNNVTNPECLKLLFCDSYSKRMNGHQTKIVRKFLGQQWRAKYESEEFDHRKIVARNLDIPLQDNETDCGMYILETIERFVSEGGLKKEVEAAQTLEGDITTHDAIHRRFLEKKTPFDRHEWFSVGDVLEKRKKMKKLIQDLVTREEMTIGATPQETSFNFEDDDDEITTISVITK